MKIIQINWMQLKLTKYDSALRTFHRTDLMFFKKHVSRLVLDFWTQENSEKIAFEQVLGFFLTFSVYIKTYHRCSEKLLQNSGFLIERTYFFVPSKVFSRAYRYFDVNKIKKKNTFPKSGWVLMDSP
jgi:hypothetical protein